MKLHFTKMHGLGNDFVILDNLKGKLRALPRLAKALCHRRFGVGADQLLVLCRSRRADFRMVIYNGDGSEAEMCGNGIRCLGKYIWDTILTNRRKSKRLRQRDTMKHLAVETAAGIIRIEKAGILVKVDMGEPVLAPEKIPVKINQIINHPLRIRNKTVKITCVSMGNPHAVTVVDDTASAPVDTIGPLMEHHRIFPKRTNVEFIRILSKNAIRMRVWERGAGETMACGTGASASAVASSLLGLTGRTVTVHLPGGKLRIQWSLQDNHVYMTGPAEKVFEGIIEI